MKIAQVCPRYYPQIGGVESHVSEISKRLAQMGHDVRVITTDSIGEMPRQEYIQDINVIRFKSWAPNDSYFFSLDLYRFLKSSSSEFDIVHAHSFHAFPALMTAYAKKTNALIFTPHYHGGGHSFVRDILHRPYGLIGKNIFIKADLVICVSDYERSLVTSKFHFDTSKLRVIPNGVDWKEFNGSAKKDVERITILYVGRLERYKRVDFLIRSLEYLERSTKLEIVGTGPDKARLAKICYELGLSDRVVFLDNLDRPALLESFRRASVLAQLSTKEAYGITVAEALASGTPCVVANNSGLSAWIDNTNCFGIVDADDPRQVALAITKAAGVVVSKAIVKDWDQVAEATLEAYNDAILNST